MRHTFFSMNTIN